MFTCGPAFFNGVPAVATDPNFAGVGLLLHYDTLDGTGTTIVDSSSRARGITRVGGPTISTTQAKFGGSSGRFLAGTNNGWQAADSADWAFGSGKFTMETWTYFTDAPSGNQALISQWITNGNLGFFLGFTGSTTFGLYYSTNGTDNPSLTTTWTPTLTTWYHVAVDRDASNVLRLYVNGAVVASATVSATLFDSTSPLTIGGGGAFATVGCYLDDTRITKGIARYAGAFTPPTAAFPNS